MLFYEDRFRNRGSFSDTAVGGADAVRLLRRMGADF
jgi:hypothetical protein